MSERSERRAAAQKTCATELYALVEARSGVETDAVVKEYLNLADDVSASLADLGTEQIKRLYRAIKRGDILPGWVVREPEYV